MEEHLDYGNGKGEGGQEKEEEKTLKKQQNVETKIEEEAKE